MEIGDNIVDLLQTLVNAVGGANWASVILLVVMLVVLVGGGWLVYRRMQSTERILNRLIDTDRATPVVPKETKP